MIIKKIKDYIVYGNPFVNHFFKEHNYIAKYLPKNPVILEAGAHTGTDTLKMLYRWKNSKIYSFEPIPLAYKKLESKAKGYKNITIFKNAFGKENSSAIMYTHPLFHASSSILQPEELNNVHPEIKLEDKVEVQVKTIDAWAKENNIDKIDLMWLDMQGYELEALKGAENILKNTKSIYTEVSFIKNYKDNPLYPEVKKWFEDRGFTIIKEEFEYKDTGNIFLTKL